MPQSRGHTGLPISLYWATSLPKLLVPQTGHPTAQLLSSPRYNRRRQQGLKSLITSCSNGMIGGVVRNEGEGQGQSLLELTLLSSHPRMSSLL